MRKNIEERTQELQQRLADMGDEILELLYEEAKGSYFTVAAKTDKRSLSGRAVCVAKDVQEVEKICRTCKQPVYKDTPEVWEVWQNKPNVAALKHLHEQIMGRAQQKRQEEVDPEIYVVFSDIESLGNAGEQKRMTERNEMKGSPDRTNPDKEILLGITEL